MERKCNLCNVNIRIANNENNWKKHIKTAKHQRNMLKDVELLNAKQYPVVDDKIKCESCNVWIKNDKNKANLIRHFKTAKHIDNRNKRRLQLQKIQAEKEQLVTFVNGIQTKDNVNKINLIITSEFNNKIIGEQTDQRTLKDFYDNRNKDLSDISEYSDKITEIVLENIPNGRLLVNALGNSGWFSVSKTGYWELNQLNNESFKVNAYTGIYAFSITQII